MHKKLLHGCQIPLGGRAAAASAAVRQREVCWRCLIHLSGWPQGEGVMAGQNNVPVPQPDSCTTTSHAPVGFALAGV